MNEKIWKFVIVSLITIVFFGLPFSMMAFGSQVQIAPFPGYRYQSAMLFQEDFISGANATGQIGASGFQINGGASTFPASEAGRPGIFQRSTTTTINTLASMYMSPATALFSGDNHRVTWITRLNNNDANTTVRIGSAISVLGNPPNDGIYFEKLDADTNWFCVTRAASTETRTDSGVAVNTVFTSFRYTKNSNVDFFINGAQVCSHALNIPNLAFSPVLQIRNSAAANKSIDVDYMELYIVDLTR